MKLISLTADNDSFKPLHFHQSGISIIVGDGAKDLNGTSNGVGKTLSLKVVHHCLGANATSDLAKSVGDWIFTLQFSIDNNIYEVSRTGDGKKIWLSGKLIGLKEYKKWLDEQDIFNLSNNPPQLTFRSLVKRFTRLLKGDCDSPTKTYKEEEYQALLRTIFLMGLDYQLAIEKFKLKSNLDTLNSQIKQYENDPTLLEFFRVGTNPKIRLEHLNREIPSLKDDIENFKVADDYRAIELEANNLTERIRDIGLKQDAITRNINNISKSIQERPDISRDDLMALYQGIEMIFKKEALHHFEAVEKFHHDLSANRKKRLEEDKLALSNELAQLDQERSRIEKSRDEKIQYLHGKNALNDYVALTNELAKLQSEQERLLEYNAAKEKLENDRLTIKEDQLKNEINAKEYVETQPITNINDQYIKLTNLLYPRKESGVDFSLNSSDRNKIRYNVNVSLEGIGSDGIGDAAILCFDWVILTLGLNHKMKMLWHDNRLFADIDPKVRATWLSTISTEAENRGLQYIISINTENLEAIKEHLSERNFNSIESRKIITLKGDIPENKLFGMNFG